MRTLIVFLSLLALVGCSEREIDIDQLVDREGIFYEAFSEEPYSGSVTGQSTGIMRDGKWDGERQEWYENGQLSGESTFENGERDGLMRVWHDNGQLAMESNFKNGELDGLIRLWHDNGQLRIEDNFKNGERDGLARSWHDNGQLQNELCFSDNTEVDMSNCKN